METEMKRKGSGYGHRKGEDESKEMERITTKFF